MAIKYLDELKIRQVDSDGVPGIHQLKLRSGALDMASIGSNFAVAWANVSGKPTTATRWPAWSEVTGKPSTFAPSAHNQAWSTITSPPAQATRWPTWSEVTNKPSTFAPSSHSHSEYNQTQYNGAYSYLGGGYNSGGTEKPNWFGSGKLKLQMLSGSNIGAPDSWNDCLWLSSYTGADVKPSNLLIFSKYNDRVGFVRQNFDSTSWGTYREIYHTGNIPTQATRWPTWSEVTSKPTTATRWPTWSEVTSKPSTFAPSTHTHGVTRTTLLGTTAFALNGTYNLSQSIQNFDLIIMYIGIYYNSASDNNSQVVAFSPASLSYGSVLSGGYNYGTNRQYGLFFPNATQVKCNTAVNLYNPRVMIEGIKYTS